MIGKRIGGRYEVLKGIGEGGMSKVYLAHDIILDRDVAIKVLNYDFVNEQEIKKRFQREALSATSLTHPHIVNIFDVGEDGEMHYLVMEYIKGQTLKRYIQTDGPLSPVQAVAIMKQLVSAIANAHHNGIIHRDIKPQNILMDDDNEVKITDFGIAMALSATSHTKTNSVIGTVHYLSPEQARGGMATKKSDIYSLGIVFYELLTGQLPFSAETAVAIALKHLQEETPSVRLIHPEIPQSVENVILKATAKDASYRYQSADEMYEDLLTVLSSERRNEEKFVVPFDDDKTKAIPVIKENPVLDETENTRIIEPVSVQPTTTVKKKRKKWPIVVSIIAALVVLVFLIMFLPGMMGPKKATIPNVVDKEEMEAIAALEEAGFIVDEKVEEFNDEYLAGRVFQTIPEAEKTREIGSVVKLYISKGKETVVLTNYIGQDYDKIVSFLERFNFKDVKSEPVYDDQPKGQIIDQTPGEGEEVVPEDTEIVFKVSLGKEVVKLGNLVGYDDKQLKEYAKTSGFDIKVVPEYHDTIEKGLVIWQKPTAESEIEKGAKVEVGLSKGPKEKPIRKRVFSIAIPFENAITENEDEENSEPEPQTVQIFIQDNEYSMIEPVEEFPITEDVQKQITIELAEGQRGGYKIFINSIIFKEETFDYDDFE